jgi:colanic acid/amylovoran biosynthesis glycosyltransferase
MPSVPPFHIAYIFERFPSFTQTFCVREIQELQRQGVRPLIFSIRDTHDEGIQHFPPDLFEQVHFLPPKDELTAKVREWKDAHQLPRAAGLCLRHWGDMPDKSRIYEAAYIAKIMADLGSAAPRHAHSHFAGIGARTCWWLRKFTGTSYSFTAHANDIFCKPGEQSPPFDRLFTDAALIVTVSDYTARQLRQQYPQAASRVQRVYNGLDLAPITAARSATDRKTAPGGILSVGRLIEKKGYEDLINACSFLRDWGVDFQCRIVGEGPLEASLKAQITRLHLAHNVELTGPLGIDDITQRLVAQTQVFALACATESDGGKDNLPTVLMEAMAASLPMRLHPRRRGAGDGPRKPHRPPLRRTPAGALRRPPRPTSQRPKTLREDGERRPGARPRALRPGENSQTPANPVRRAWRPPHRSRPATSPPGTAPPLGAPSAQESLRPTPSSRYADEQQELRSGWFH